MFRPWILGLGFSQYLLLIWFTFGIVLSRNLDFSFYMTSLPVKDLFISRTTSGDLAPYVCTYICIFTTTYLIPSKEKADPSLLLHALYLYLADHQPPHLFSETFHSRSAENLCSTY